MTLDLTSSDALLVVDYQLCFCPGGTLPVPEGDRLVGVINRWIDRITRAGGTVAASRDRHPPDHISFRQRGGPWPPHCVRDTDETRFHPDLRLPSDAIIITKGQAEDYDQYSAFDRTDLADLLRERNVSRVWIAGLAMDVCVKATALDAVDAGFETHVLLDATRPTTGEAGDKALESIRRAGVIIEENHARA
ncbi:MAG: isochorismatase family protein [Planctomycetota bacterium]